VNQKVNASYGKEQGMLLSQ